MKIKSCVGWMCVCLSLTFAANAQIVWVENGFSIAKVSKIFDDRNVFPYQMSAGVEYWDHGTYSLSSQVGFLKKGGKARLADWNEGNFWGGNIPLRLHGRYITFNTTFDLKTRPVGGLYWYFGLGPRIDVKINNSLYWDEGVPYQTPASMSEMRAVLWGLKCAIGVRKEIGKLQVGLQAAYLPTFNKMFKTAADFSGGRDRTFTLGLSFGYLLAKDKGRHYTVRKAKNKVNPE